MVSTCTVWLSLSINLFEILFKYHRLTVLIHVFCPFLIYCHAFSIIPPIGVLHPTRPSSAIAAKAIPVQSAIRWRWNGAALLANATTTTRCLPTPTNNVWTGTVVPFVWPVRKATSNKAPHAPNVPVGPVFSMPFFQ